jgi:hypothetical protein
MSKESGSFLRKVARFVANPTTDWAALDAPVSDPAESEYAKTEIKAMIERKRRNDFVRKRELDMLRKIRREGLSPDAAMALGNPSNLDPDSRPQNGARSDIAVKAKIDEIELQMVGTSSRQATAAPIPTLAPHGGSRFTDGAPTAPNPLALAPTVPVDLDEPPQISQAVFDAARASVPMMPGQSIAVSALAPTGFQTEGAFEIAETPHDPELDEAVIAFANADFDQCEQCLMDLVQPGAIRHETPETWMVLFDFYRTLDLPQKFDQLAVSFAQKFGLSAPQWYSLPQKVADFLAANTNSAPSAPHRDRHPEDSSSTPDTQTLPPASATALEGWIAPPLIDTDAVAQLRVEVLQLPRPWVMDWGQVRAVSAEGAHNLGQLMRNWAQEAQALSWVGTEHLSNVLADSSATGNRDADPAYWMLRLDILRLSNRPDQFDEVAIDYCVTYELSPPSWEPALCTVREMNDAIAPHTRSLSHVSDVTTTFVESQLHHEVEFVQVAALNLSGQLIGDIGHTLGQLNDSLGASVTLEIDCQHLLRVDFIAAGDLLNWVLARRAEDRFVIFNNPHRLIALFFGAMGINEHAKVKLQTV